MISANPEADATIVSTEVVVTLTLVVTSSTTVVRRVRDVVCAAKVVVRCAVECEVTVAS